MCARDCVNCQKSVHWIKNSSADLICEPVKCLMNGTVLVGPPNDYHALNTSRPTLIADFLLLFPH